MTKETVLVRQICMLCLRIQTIFSQKAFHLSAEKSNLSWPSTNNIIAIT